VKLRFEVAVGLFVVVGFIILSMIVFFVSGVYFFRPGYHLKAQFDYVGILNQGAPVRFAGFRVGEVSGIRILDAENKESKPRVEVQFFVKRGVVIKEHYEVSIRGNHIMSEPHVAVTPAPGEGRILKNGDLIANGVSPQSMEDLFRHGTVILERMNKVLTDVSSAFDDPETRTMLRESMQNMSALLKSMNEIVVGEEEEFRAMVVNLNQVADQMVQLLDRLNRGEGTLGKLVTEEEIYNDLREFVREIKTHPWRLFKKK